MLSHLKMFLSHDKGKASENIFWYSTKCYFIVKWLKMHFQWPPLSPLRSTWPNKIRICYAFLIKDLKCFIEIDLACSTNSISMNCFADWSLTHLINQLGSGWIRFWSKTIAVKSGNQVFIRALWNVTLTCTSMMETLIRRHYAIHLHSQSLKDLYWSTKRLYTKVNCWRSFSHVSRANLWQLHLVTWFFTVSKWASLKRGLEIIMGCEERGHLWVICGIETGASGSTSGI